MYGEVILNRLPLHSVLHDKNHPMYKIIDNSVGEWLDNYDIIEWFNQFFINTAKGAYLDLWGHEFKVKRRPDEDDESYRQRIIYEMLGRLTFNYLLDVFGVELYTNPVGGYVDGSTLVSDNPYLENSNLVDGFIGRADPDTQKVLNRKFVLDGVITWL